MAFPKASWCWASTAAGTRCIKRAEDLGFSSDKEELDVLYERFTALADRKKGVRNEEIVALVHEVVDEKAVAAAND